MNLYDVLAGQGTTHFERLFSQRFAGGAVQTLTGQPPISFLSDGKPLISWSIKGNTQQQGTPTPDNPVMPEFVGKMSAQIIPYPFYSPDGEYAGVQFTTDNGRIIANGTLTSGLLYYLWRPAKFPAGTYTMSVKGKHSGATIYFRDTTNNVSVASIYGAQEGDRSTTFTITEEISAIVYVNAVSGTVDFDCTIMLNAGEEALPFEPTNGWKIPLTCAGQTVTVYLGQTPTVRRIRKLVLTGEEEFGRNSSTSTYSLDVDCMGKSGILTALSSHYLGVDNVSAFASMTDKAVCERANGEQIWIRDTDRTSVSDFKSYLASQYANGTPVTVWYVLAEPETGIVNKPLCKIGDYADELNSTDAGVSIPTAKGNNVLTIGTDLQPSEMTITFKG